jgi:arylsulfatase A-like enzyme
LRIAAILSATTRGLLATTHGLLAAALVAGCSRGPGSKCPRLVVLYAPCTVRTRSLSPYDPSIPFTPALADFARSSVVFRRHTTEAEQSGTAFASIFTGAQAPIHGVYHHPAVLGDGLVLLAETFAAAGFETWFWSGHPMAGVRLGYGQGVPPEHDVQITRASRDSVSPEEALVWSGNDARMDALLDGLAADPKRHAFVQIDFTLSHAPYLRFCTPERVAAFLRDFPERAGGLEAPEVLRLGALFGEHQLEFQWDPAGTTAALALDPRERERLGRALQILYETDVRDLDRLFGAFVEKVRSRGLLPDSVIVFTADHGEVLDRPNAAFHWTHGFQLAPESLDVPWILCAPGRIAPGEYAKVTRSIDVYPTLAGISGVPVAPGAKVAGTDLAPALRGERPAPDLLAFSHSTFPSTTQFEQLSAFPPIRRMFPRPDPELIAVRVRSGDRVCKLVNRGETFGLERFDLASDPSEERDLFDPRDATDAELARQLEAYKAELVRGARAIAERDRLSRDEEEARLRSLGYVK